MNAALTADTNVVHPQEFQSILRAASQTQAGDAPPYSEPARTFPGVPVIAGSLVGLAVTVAGSWLLYRRWQARKAAAMEALTQATKPGRVATPVAANAAA